MDDFGWHAYAPLADAVPGVAYRSRLEVDRDDDPSPDGQDERLRLSDVGKLARRARRRVIGVARADDERGFTALLSEHLGAALAGLEVVEESWPGYDQVNLAAALDAWLAAPGRSHRLVGMAGYRHQEFGLGDLLRPTQGFGPVPGNVAWTSLASGPDGQVTRAVRAGVYLVTEEGGVTEGGGARIALLVLGADPDNGRTATQVHLVSDDPDAAAAAAVELRRLSLELNVFRGQVISFGHDMFGERGGCCSSGPGR